MIKVYNTIECKYNDHQIIKTYLKFLKDSKI